MRPNTDIRSLIRSGSIPEPNSGCWLWERNANPQGYGKLTILGKTVFAHRASYAAFVAEIPAGLQICHRCDVPCCVNPDHLFVGSAAVNHADRNAKGRQARGDRQGLRKHPERAPIGERNASAKLDSERVLTIRQRLSAGEKVSNLATQFNVSVAAIRFIQHRRTWRHI